MDLLEIFRVNVINIEVYIFLLSFKKITSSRELLPILNFSKVILSPRMFLKKDIDSNLKFLEIIDLKYEGHSKNT